MCHLRRASLYALLALAMLACSEQQAGVDGSVLGTWAVEKVVYDDGSENVLGPGNFVEIDSDDLVERIQGGGARRYAYVREGAALRLGTGASAATWTILENAPGLLRIKTPIGIYVLRPAPAASADR